MPIRTTRGRAAAYRPVWQWPLRSPLRLVVTAAVIVAVGALVGVGAAAAGGNRADPPPAPAPTRLVPAPYTYGTAAATTTPAPSVLPPVAALTPTTLPVAQAPAAALDVAARWTAAWVRPPDGTTAAAWLDRLRPMTTDEYLGVMSGVDPAKIPATKVTGAPAAVRVAPRSVLVDVPTDAVTLVVTVVDTDSGGWKVSGYDRA